MNASNKVSNFTTFSTMELDELKENVDTLFLLTNATFICLMQCGFACIEAGSTRSKNVTNIMMKNVLDVFISCVAFWVTGYAIAYGGGGPFIGFTFWAGAGIPEPQFVHWFFQFVFAATAATIVSGAAAERCNFVAYLTYSAFISGFTYPIVAHWVWAPTGWLNELGFIDFAGSGVVHLVGGVSAGVAAVLLGPRIGRFDGDKMPGHSIPLIGIGGMILLTGFLAFNGGSLGTITAPGAGAVVSVVMANTVVAASGAAITGMTASRFGLLEPKSWNFVATLNAAVTGMVAVCASANIITFWSSLLLGVSAGFLYVGLHRLVLFFKVDDPLDATAVHLGGGLWGVLIAPILKENGVIYGPNKENFTVFLYNVIGALAILCWSLTTSLFLFGVLKYFKVLRVSKEDELKGLDITKHQEPAYTDVVLCASRFSETTNNTHNYKKDSSPSKPVNEYINESFQTDNL